MLTSEDKIEVRNIVEDVVTKIVEDLIKPSFELVYKKFDEIDKRFEQMEKRFANVETRLDRVETKLDSMDKKLNVLTDQTTLHDKTLIEHEGRISSLEQTSLPD
ncbi:MAG: hypothetical protein Q8Q24_00620 [bacterium]|nr:hypothetical protein [bacterium]